MDPECSLPCSQKPTIGPYPEASWIQSALSHPTYVQLKYYPYHAKHVCCRRGDTCPKEVVV
jgi:hypothetical protein